MNKTKKEGSGKNKKSFTKVKSFKAGNVLNN